MKSFSRRQGLTLGAAALLEPGAWAQSAYPERGITLVDCFPAGGSTDLFARVLAQQLGALLGTTVVVDNKPGAGGALGSEFIAHAKPDGYTLGLATVSTLCTNPAINPKLRYDPLKDFSHISKLLTLPSLLAVHPEVPASNLQELLALARAKPEQVSFATPGIGSAGHVLLEQFQQLAGVRFLHVPYKGGTQIATDLIAGRLMVASDNIPTLLPHVQSGKLRAVAVRDTRRIAVLPQIATYAEQGFAPVSDPLWFGLIAPAGLPAALVQTLNAAVQLAVASSAFAERLKAVSASAAAGTPAAFAAEARTLYERFAQVVRVGGLKPE